MSPDVTDYDQKWLCVSTWGDIDNTIYVLMAPTLAKKKKCCVALSEQP